MEAAAYLEYFRHFKGKSLLERNSKKYIPNNYSSSSDFWNIRITEARVDSEEKYVRNRMDME